MDVVKTVTTDKKGNVFVVGITTSKDFPVTEGSYDTEYNGGLLDVFISKFPFF